METGQRMATEGRVQIKLRDWKGLEDHLKIFFDRKQNKVEISWVCDCNDPSCEAPHEAPNLVLYVCPSRPCPR